MKSNQKKVYEIVPKLPVARFYYQGTHTHPVRRTVVIIEETATHLRGYEFREGKTVRTMQEAMSRIKSYRKDRIAKWGDYSRLMSGKNIKKNPDSSTLERESLVNMFSAGV